MNIIEREEDILRRTLELHMQAFLDGKEPMYMAQETATTRDEVNNNLRRCYEPVHEDMSYSHISYLGKRELELERTHLQSGRTFVNKVMVGNAPLTKGLVRRARNFYEYNPDLTSEAIADLVLAEHKLTINNRNYYRDLRTLRGRIKNWWKRVMHTNFSNELIL